MFQKLDKFSPKGNYSEVVEDSVIVQSMSNKVLFSN